MDELIQEFLVESNEGLDRLDSELVKLEAAPDSPELLASIFRTIHSIKGACGFLGFQKLETLAHAAENLLSKLRDGRLRFTPEIGTAMLAAVDAIRQMLTRIGATGQDGDENYVELVQQLKRLQENTETINQTGEAVEKNKEQMQVTTLADSNGSVTPSKNSTGPKPPNSRSASPQGGKKFQPQAGKLGGALIERHKVTVDDLATALKAQENGDARPIGEILVSLGALTAEDLAEALKMLDDCRANGAAQDSTIRVNVNLLDRLMTLVGELVLARNQLLQFASAVSDNSFHAISQRMNLIASELQEQVMKTRMQPIGNIWSKFPRTVRDLVVSCGKDVRIEMEGQETELDKTIIEAVKDPLTHLIRNAVDHGIEMPDVRRRAGKSPAGCLRLRAFHEGGQVNIEISDDGAGLNVERIRNKAVERGLISTEQAARLSERDIFHLIFLPGFSTAEKVTNVSGRGVGMDVVRTNIEKIGGSVDVQSVAGEGTTVRIKIPLTLAIIPALVVTCGAERYAIPQVSLLELIRMEGEQARRGIEMIHDAPVYRLRGQLLPLVFLERELQPEDGQEQVASKELPDFVMARERHRQWIDKLRDVIEGKSTLTLNEAGAHTECALGKWLYGSGLRAYIAIAEIFQLEQAHRHFHEAVRGVVAAKHNGQHADANHQFEKVRSVSEQVIELISVVERKAIDHSAINVVVLQADGRLFGLVVDGISDTEEIVVKPLRKQLKHIKTFAGASIMGDGRVALILDVQGLAQRAHVLTETKARGQLEVAKEAGERAQDKQNFLVFEGPEGARMAVPLETVARLEELPAAQVEKAGAHWLAQYRGGLLPLVNLTAALEEQPVQRKTAKLAGKVDGKPWQVLVCHDGDKSAGLVVERILDIVEERPELKYPASRAGILCSAVIAGRVAELLDVSAILSSAGVQDAAEVAQ